MQHGLPVGDEPVRFGHHLGSWTPWVARQKSFCGEISDRALAIGGSGENFNTLISVGRHCRVRVQRWMEVVGSTRAVGAELRSNERSNLMPLLCSATCINARIS